MKKYMFLCIGLLLGAAVLELKPAAEPIFRNIELQLPVLTHNGYLLTVMSIPQSDKLVVETLRTLPSNSEEPFEVKLFTISGLYQVIGAIPPMIVHGILRVDNEYFVIMHGACAKAPSESVIMIGTLVFDDKILRFMGEKFGFFSVSKIQLIHINSVAINQNKEIEMKILVSDDGTIGEGLLRVDLKKREPISYENITSCELIPYDVQVHERQEPQAEQVEVVQQELDLPRAVDQIIAGNMKYLEPVLNELNRNPEENLGSIFKLNGYAIRTKNADLFKKLGTALHKIGVSDEQFARTLEEME